MVCDMPAVWLGEPKALDSLLILTERTTLALGSFGATVPAVPGNALRPV
jgi:hypothetical protein